jgi:hypothetical protein
LNAGLKAKRNLKIQGLFIKLNKSMECSKPSIDSEDFIIEDDAEKEN